TADLDVFGVCDKEKYLKWLLAKICQSKVHHGERAILRRIGSSIQDRNGRLLAWTRILPDFPRRVTMSVHVVQLLLVLKSVHGCIKAIMAICHQLLLSHKAFKRLKDELLAIAHVLEDFFLEDEIAPIDAKIGIRCRLDVIYRP